jgi:hypothetical protein
MPSMAAAGIARTRRPADRTRPRTALSALVLVSSLGFAGTKWQSWSLAIERRYHEFFPRARLAAGAGT